MEQDAMQGIMGVGGAAMPAAQGPQAMTDIVPEVSADEMAAFERARQEIPPPEFANELMTASEEIDLAEVQELRQVMTQANLPMDVLLAIIQMVEAVLADPGQYAQNRAELISEGVPPDLLPEQFDAEFFGALQLAVEQHIATMPAGGMEPQGFADGGLASLRPIAQELQSFGRNGDTMLAHITPQEARMLQRMGGSGTINPVTGLREYFLGGVAKAVGNAFKSAGKAVGNAVKGVASATKKFVQSPVGRVATAVALGFFVGPAAASMLGVSSLAGVAAVSGFVGGFGSSVLAGDALGASLRNGAIGGVLAGAGAGVMGGAEAFQAGSYAGPTTVSGQWESLKSGVSNVFSGPTAEALPVTPQADIASRALPPVQAPSVPAVPAPGDPTGLNIPVPTAAPASDPTMTLAGARTGATGATGTGATGTGTSPSFLSRVREFISPSTPSAEALNTIGAQAVQQAQSASTVPLTEAMQNQIFERAVAEATPSMLRQYGPLVAGGLGVMGLAGGFSEPEPQAPGILPTLTGYDLLEQDPERYGVTLGPTETTYASPQARPIEEEYADFYASMAQNPFLTGAQNPYAMNTMGQQSPRFMAQGGTATQQQFPRKTGAINGPGTETSDSIPAMLSDGEFVFTAQAVRGAGGGSRRDGAKRMYQMMKQFEKEA